MAGRRVRYVIFASPKSGTQWVQELLRAHPDVMCAETRAFGEQLDLDHASGVNITLESYVSILRRYHRPPEGRPDHFRGLLFDLLDAVAAASLRASGRSIYGEKITPFLGTAGAVVDRLAEYDPDLRFVHLSRDGRDVIVSGHAHYALIHGRPAGRRVTPDMLAFFTDLWTQATSAALGARDRFRHHLHVRYEDLLDDTPAELARLLEFIGADPGAAGRCAEAASFERMSGGRRRGEEDLGSVVRKGVAGDWRNWLTDEQAAWFEHRAAPLMTRLRKPGPSPGSPAPAVAGGSR